MMKEKETHKVNWQLIAKDISGELSEEEHMQLAKEFEGSGDLQSQLNILLDDAKYAQEIKLIDTEGAWKNVRNNLSRNKKGVPITLKRLMSIAASLIIFLVSYYAVHLFYSASDQQLVTARNELQSILLNDGTTVDLNIGSSIEFPQEFDADSRTVHLEGEAFFDVMRDDEKPFIINTKQISIKVLGTSFNVKENPLSGNAKVVVSSGEVEVWHEQTMVLLKQGECAVFVAETNKLLKRAIDNVNYKAWKTKRLEFDNTRLSEVVTTLEDVYHIQIEVDSLVAIDSLVLNATFSQYTINHVLESVCAPFNLEYRMDNGKYRIVSLQ